MWCWNDSVLTANRHHDSLRVSHTCSIQCTLLELMIIIIALASRHQILKMIVRLLKNNSIHIYFMVIGLFQKSIFRIFILGLKLQDPRFSSLSGLYTTLSEYSSGRNLKWAFKMMLTKWCYQYRLKIHFENRP